MVLVADFTMSPSQVDYDAPVFAGVLFTTTIQNIFKFAAAAVTSSAIVVVDLPTIIIIIVAAAAAAAAVTNRISKVSNQRQLR